MKVITEVKVFTFKGEDAEIRCEEKVNEGIENDWQPVGFSSYILDGQKVIKVLMGNTKEPKKKEPEEEPKKEEKEGVVSEETTPPPPKPAPEKEVEPEKTEQLEEVEEEEQEGKQESPEPEVEGETVEETPPPPPEKKETETKSKYEKCPRCGNIALEVQLDRSANCDYCGFIVRDIKKAREKLKEEE
ncbi:MAG: hypothetical protein ACQESD_05590 [Thermoplasmatota archaeon]